MRTILIKILFWLLKIPIASKVIDHDNMKEWIGLQHPQPNFQNYIAVRSLHLLQLLGEGVSNNDEYWTIVGQRVELAKLLTEAKVNFERTQKKIEKRKNENTKSNSD